MNATEISQLVSTILLVGGLVVYVWSRLKRQPEEKEKTEVSVAKATLDIMHNSVELWTNEYEEQFKRMSKQFREDREQWQKDREELRLLHSKQIAEERKSSENLHRQLLETSEKLSAIRKILQETQKECDLWKKKYETETKGS